MRTTKDHLTPLESQGWARILCLKASMNKALQSLICLPTT